MASVLLVCAVQIGWLNEKNRDYIIIVRSWNVKVKKFHPLDWMKTTRIKLFRSANQRDPLDRPTLRLDHPSRRSTSTNWTQTPLFFSCILQSQLNWRVTFPTLTWSWRMAKQHQHRCRYRYELPSQWQGTYCALEPWTTRDALLDWWSDGDEYCTPLSRNTLVMSHHMAVTTQAMTTNRLFSDCHHQEQKRQQWH